MLTDLHSHSTLSDGTLSPEEMVAAATRHGYDAYALTDHANGDRNNHREMAEAVRSEIERLAPETPIKLFAGIEITDYEPGRISEVAREARRAGAQVIVVHGECVSMYVQPGTNAAAVRCPDVDILGHPGLLTEEDALAARRNEVFVELSARQGHCWANGHVHQIVRKVGTSVVVDSDAHEEDSLLSPAKVAAVVRGSGAHEIYLARVRDQYAPAIVHKLENRLALV